LALQQVLDELPSVVRARARVCVVINVVAEVKKWEDEQAAKVKKE
jgi:hypothetical protein